MESYQIARYHNMSFWNYLGLAALWETLFGRKSRPYINQLSQSMTSRQYLDREAQLDARYDRVSNRIDELEGRLDEFDSELYEDLDDQIDELREELYDLEDERYKLDDEYFDEHEDW